MHKIKIISSSVRAGRNSHRVALFFQDLMKEGDKNEVEILDLKKYEFPLFDERLRFQKDPLPRTREFAEKVKSAEGIIIVTPEYNGGYPASLKNVTDLLYDEWKRKPIAIVTVSSGSFGGTQVITSLQFSLWKIGALTVPAMFPVAEVEKTFMPDGVPTDPEKTRPRAEKFLSELFYYVDAMKKMAGSN